MIKLPLLGLALLQLAASSAPGPTPDRHHLRYQRAVNVAPGPSPHACAVLSADLFSHAAPSLTDLRLYDGADELPYVLTLSDAATPTNDPATVSNLGTQSGRIVFDLQMPARSYTNVTLALAARDFLATARVSGERPGVPATQLGEYTLFDLTSQHLSRSTTLGLQESTFPVLHVELTFTPAPGAPAQIFSPAIVTGASVPPSREAQTLYTPVAETSTLLHRNHRTIAEFHIPARVPVERIAFVLPPGFQSNFSRPVLLTAQAGADPGNLAEQLSGEISRVNLPSPATGIHHEQLTVPATLGSNMQTDAVVAVAIADGDDRPLPIASVRLEMRQRQLCFDPPAAAPILYYGDSELHAPVYDYARLFAPTAPVRIATLDPEQPNPAYTPRADSRPFTERHPELLWLVLLAAVGALGFTAFRSAKSLPK
jgi:hypothetical protein